MRLFALFLAGCAMEVTPLDAATPDMTCWQPNICYTPECCDPRCDGPFNGVCLARACTPGEVCGYFEGYCACQADGSWLYKSTAMPPDLSVVDLSSAD